MILRLGICSFLALALLGSGGRTWGGASAAAYLTEEAWLAALPFPAPVVPLPPHSATAQDAFATYENGVPQTVTYFTSNAPNASALTITWTWNLDISGGQMNGYFHCVSYSYPCLGAHTITYTFPFNIIGMSGHLMYYFGPLGEPEYSINFFDIPKPAPTSDDPYYPTRPWISEGFYGALFAPTNTITMTWLPGLRNIDEAAFFILRSARVALAVPEPAALLVLAGGLLGLGFGRRMRGVANDDPCREAARRQRFVATAASDHDLPTFPIDEASSSSTARTSCGSPT